MKQFNLKKEDYYAEGWKLYNTTIFTIDPGVTVLVGCNGSGKSTLLRFIDRQLENEKIPRLFFDNLCDGGNHSMNKALFYGDMDFVIRSAMASEGERIFNNIYQIASRCGRSIRASKQEGANEFFLLLDAIDSGFSVDNIVDIKKIYSMFSLKMLIRIISYRILLCRQMSTSWQKMKNVWMSIGENILNSLLMMSTENSS